MFTVFLGDNEMEDALTTVGGRLFQMQACCEVFSLVRDTTSLLDE